MLKGVPIDKVIDYAADKGCEHIEFVPFCTPFVDEESGRINTDYIDAVKEKCAERSLEISTYSVNANIIDPDEKKREAEIKRVMLHIDAAARLGISYMRHDVAAFRRSFEENTVANFEKTFPLMIEGVRRLYDYADSLGVHTTLENHGFFCNGSDRIIRLIEEANRKHLSMTMDVGNFACVDEDCTAAVKKCLRYARIIHFKDFYIRDKRRLPGQTGMFRCDDGCWFETLGGKMLRGSIVGQGDLDIFEIARAIEAQGFDGYLSIEFEGMEECKKGTEISLDMTRGIFGIVKNEMLSAKA